MKDNRTFEDIIADIYFNLGKIDTLLNEINKKLDEMEEKLDSYTEL